LYHAAGTSPTQTTFEFDHLNRRKRTRAATLSVQFGSPVGDALSRAQSCLALGPQLAQSGSCLMHQFRWRSQPASSSRSNPESSAASQHSLVASSNLQLLMANIYTTWRMQTCQSTRETSPVSFGHLVCCFS
jgi:hypothetical protein